ncbi:endolytic transglycosylase MltG [Wenyingzhuangia sp. IMCC45533]
MKKIFWGLGIFSLLIVSVSCYFYNIIYSGQIQNDTKFFIGSHDNIDDVTNKLSPVVVDIQNIKTVASLKKYTHVKPGMYVLKKGMNANEIINLLRSGRQTPIKVTFNNQRYIENLAERLAQQIEADSTAIINSLLDIDFLENKGFNKKTAINYCMPYTYNCYWNISPNDLREKLYNAYQRFWTDERLLKAKDLNLSKNQVITLASIVQSETQYKPERKRIAGVYLNRLKRGIPLQADPTANYAWKEKYGRDIVIKRTLHKHLKLNHPYNTYVQRGLPPSAIAMPDVDAIDAVLNAERHSFIYFCANPAKAGTHSFAKTLAQHNRNAAIYQRWYRKQFSNR